MSDYDEEKLAAFEAVVEAFAGLTSGGWLRRPCPLCEDRDGKPDLKASLGYNTETGGFNCHKCQTHGSLPRNWRAKLELAEPTERKAKFEKPTLELPDEFVPIFSGQGETAARFDAHRSYVVRPKSEVIDGVKGRGMSWETAEAIGIGVSMSGHTTYSKLDPKYARRPPLLGRVIAPLTENGEWKGWVARDITGRAFLPYLYPSNMERDGLLFNPEALLVETDRPCFITEGVFDTTLLYPDAVSCMGKPLASHMRRWLSAKRPLVFALDGDAWEEAWMHALTLRHLGRQAGSIRFKARQDPDEVPRDWLDQAAAAALAA